MGSFEASYKDFNLHILSAELGGVRCIRYLTVVCTYQRDQQRGGGVAELNALWNKSWAYAQALSHKCRCRAWGRAKEKQCCTVQETGPVETRQQNSETSANRNSDYFYLALDITII
jgi:hypothetical protein